MRRALIALLSLLGTAGMAWTEEPVLFGDPKFKALVERELGIADPTPTDMLSLTELDYIEDWDEQDEGVLDISGLEYAKNLQTLTLRLNRISDISFLAGLTNLTSLNLSENEISDLSPLAGLTNLTDLNLHANKISDLSPLAGLTKVRTLVLRFNEVSDLSALSSLTHLHEIDLGENKVSDLSPLSGLTELTTLALWSNAISDLSPLSGLTKLTSLDVRINRVSDLSPLSGLSVLRSLDLENNRVSDISPLCGLTSLRSLNLQGNYLTEEAYDIYIPQIQANNPSIHIDYDLHVGKLLSVSSTPGGRVIDPGEGDFTYDYDAPVRLEAEARPGFVFAGWSGDYANPRNPGSITMDRDCQIRANFRSLLAVLHVDDDAAGDLGPADPARSDPNEDGTPEHPFDRIQEAIEVAGSDVSLIVHPGLYRENLDLLGKTLHLTGIDPGGLNEGPAAIIAGAGVGPVVRFTGGSLSSSLTGFVTSRNGANGTFTGFVVVQGRDLSTSAILCDNSSPTIAHCLIVGNRSTDPDGATISCLDSQAVLTNCTIADNDNGPQGAALVLLDSDVTITNSILWGNSPKQILVEGTSNPLIRYCDVQGWWPDYGNLSGDPLFARRGAWVSADNPQALLSPAHSRAVWRMGDYHVQSQAGRWQADGRVWVQDGTTSPCIDGGDPSSPVGAEPAPNGGITNMGSYGGTAEASKSYLRAGFP